MAVAIAAVAAATEAATEAAAVAAATVAVAVAAKAPEEEIDVSNATASSIQPKRNKLIDPLNL